MAKLLDKFSHISFFDFLAKSGIFISFGFLGIYYWYGNNWKKNLKQIIIWQLILFIISLFFLFAYNLFTIKGIIGIIIFNVAGISLLSFYLLFLSGLGIISNYFIGKDSCPGVAPLIPGVEIPNVPITPPFFEGWLSILIILIVHEFAHGVLARRAKVMVKSFGIILAGIFPIGAFTEPDEEQLKNVSDKHQLKVYSAGASFNMYLGLIIIAIVMLFGLIFSGFVNDLNKSSIDGLYIANFSAYTGLCNDGVKSLNYGVYDNNLKILKMNDLEINDMNDFMFVQKQALDANQSYITFTFSKDNNVFDGNLYFNADNKFGITLKTNKKENLPFWVRSTDFIFSLLYWLWTLNFAVAFVNFVPSEPFDGGKMVKLILPKFMLKKYPLLMQKEIIGKTFGLIFLVLLAINILPLFF